MYRIVMGLKVNQLPVCCSLTMAFSLLRAPSSVIQSRDWCAVVLEVDMSTRDFGPRVIPRIHCIEDRTQCERT